MLFVSPRGIVALVEFAGLDRERGDADARQAEVVRAIVAACRGARIGDDGEIEPLRCRLDGREEAGALRSVDVDLLRNADGKDHVVVDVEGDLAGGDGWVLAEIFGAEEALFFGGDGGEDEGVGRLDTGLGPGAGEFEDHAYAGGVVGGSVVDVVAGHAGDEAEMVVVGGVEDGLIGASCIGSGEDTDHVGGLEGADGALDVGVEADGEFDGFEAGFSGGGYLGVGVETSGGEEFLSDVELDPAGGLELGIFIVAEVGFFAGVGVFDDVPAVAGEVGAVNDECADGAFASGFLELVGPAAVVGEGVAAEELWVVRGRIADDAEDDFAFDVDVGVVVPVELGRVDAVADEDDGGVDVDGGGEGAVADGVVVAVLQVDGVEIDGHAGGGFLRHEGEGGFGRDGVHADEVDLLEVGAVVAAGLEAVQGKLRCDVLCDELAATQSGAATFEEIVGEKLHLRADFFSVDGGFRCLYRRGNGLGEKRGSHGEGNREERNGCGYSKASLHVGSCASKDDSGRRYFDKFSLVSAVRSSSPGAGRFDSTISGGVRTCCEFGMFISMWMKPILTAGLALALVCPVGAQEKVLAATPPMGWNSWDSYGLTINEEQFRQNMTVLTAQLKEFGWQYVVVDEGWYLQNPELATKPEALRYTTNEHGQYEPAPNRFPSAKNGAGFKPLAEAAHENGLKFGIHIIRGIPKQAVTANTRIGRSRFRAGMAADSTDVCPWNPDNFGVKANAAGQAWYDALMKQYADWGVDFVKVDCIASHPYKAAEIKMIHRAIQRAGRPMVLSLSPGPTALANAAEVGANAQMWRISQDVWDHWRKGREWSESVKGQFPLIASWAKYAKPGNWPDADMLPIGELGPTPGDGAPRTTRLTEDEQRTMLTLWAIGRSPLFLGANLTKMDAFTKSMLTNPGLIAVDQHSVENHALAQEGSVVAWTAQSSTGPSSYLALFNLGDGPVRIEKPFSAYELAKDSYKMRDIWERKELDVHTGVSVELPAHGSVLFELKP